MEFEFFNDSLPIELVSLIFSFLDLDEQFMIGLCCKKLRSLVNVKMDVPTLSENASKKGYISILKWLRQTKYDLLIEQESCRLAAKYGQLEVLKYLDSIGLYFDIYCGYQASKHGHLEILRTFKNDIVQSGKIKDVCCQGAIEGGHIPILAWLYQNDILYFKKEDISKIINLGHIKLLKWVYYNLNYEFEKKDVMVAIYYGRFDILIWLIKKNTPYDKIKCLLKAKECNHSVIFNWIIKNL